MSRINRKRLGLDRLCLLEGTNDMFDSVDNMVKETYYISDDEFDYICEQATDEDLFAITSLFVRPTCTKAKLALEVVDKYITKMYDNE